MNRLIYHCPPLLVRSTLAAAGWGHSRVAGWEHSRVPSWALPARLAAASSAHSQRLVGTAVRHNSSCLGWAAAPAWAWLRAHGTCHRQVALCLGWGSMPLVGVAVGVAAAGGNGWAVEYGRTPREGWSCVFRQSIRP